MQIKPGDTLESIARRIYGDERKAALLRKANPGLDTLSPGASLAIPEDPEFTLPGSVTRTNTNEVAIIINGRLLRYWQAVRIRRSIDLITTVDLVAPFEPEDAENRRTFRPFSYAPTEIKVGGSLLFKGTLIGVDPALDTKTNTVSLSLYGRPGVMGDCTAPASAYEEGNGSIEWDAATLEVIAADVAGYFGIAVQFEDPSGAPFERVGLGTNKKVLQFLIELAAQRNLVISDTPGGSLLFKKAATSGASVATLEAGEAGPVVTASALFSPQEYYSHVTGIAPVIIGLAGTQYTVKNTRLSGEVRPYTFDSVDLLDSEIKGSVESKVSRMFANAVAYEVTVATWRSQSGDLWEPNTIVTFKAPRLMVYSSFDFLVRSVEFNKTANEETAVLNLVLLGSLAGQIPEALPWDG